MTHFVVYAGFSRSCDWIGGRLFSDHGQLFSGMVGAIGLDFRIGRFAKNILAGLLGRSIFHYPW